MSETERKRLEAMREQVRASPGDLRLGRASRICSNVIILTVLR